MVVPEMGICYLIESGATEPSTAPKGNGETVLLIDEETEIFMVARVILTQNGYKVLTGAIVIVNSPSP